MFTMGTLGHLLCLLFIASSTFGVVLYQTIPENNSLVCSGEVLQYTCITNEDGLGWTFDLGEELASAFSNTDDINSTKMSGQFELKLTARNGTVYTSTATNNNITSNYDNTQVGCVGGSIDTATIIAVADGPANCSDIDVLCKTASNAANDSRTDILIYLTTNSSLMCVVEYQIQFGQIIMSVSATSSSTNFTISKTELQGQSFVNGTIYTLDAENRMGQIPCLFSIAEPTAVANITFVLECDKSSLTVSVRVSWMPSEIEGCLDDDTKLEYIIEFHSSSFSNIRRTFDISYMLPGVPEGIDLEVTITPTLPDLGLSGSPLSTTVHIVKTSCVASSFPTTSSTTLSTVAPTGASNLGVILGVIFALILILVLVVLIVLITRYCYKNGKCAAGKQLTAETEEADVHNRKSEFRFTAEELQENAAASTSSHPLLEITDVSNERQTTEGMEEDDHNRKLEIRPTAEESPLQVYTGVTNAHDEEQTTEGPEQVDDHNLESEFKSTAEEPLQQQQAGSMKLEARNTEQTPHETELANLDQTELAASTSSYPLLEVSDVNNEEHPKEEIEESDDHNRESEFRSSAEELLLQENAAASTSSHPLLEITDVSNERQTTEGMEEDDHNRKLEFRPTAEEIPLQVYTGITNTNNEERTTEGPEQVDDHNLESEFKSTAEEPLQRQQAFENDRLLVYMQEQEERLQNSAEVKDPETEELIKEREEDTEEEQEHSTNLEKQEHLQNKLTEVEDRNVQQKETIENLREQLKERDREITDLRKNLEQKNVKKLSKQEDSQLEQLQKELEKYTSREQLEKETEKDSNYFEDKLEHLQNKLTEVERENVQQKKTIEKLRELLRERDIEIADLRKQMASLTAQFISFTAKYNEDTMKAEKERMKILEAVQNSKDSKGHSSQKDVDQASFVQDPLPESLQSVDSESRYVPPEPNKPPQISEGEPNQVVSGTVPTPTTKL